MSEATADRGEKLAWQTAQRIRRDVARSHWPVGRLIGSEADLVERYGVSGPVLRESTRIIEHLQIGRVRRGPGGGLVVAAPTLDAALDALAVYLEFAKVSVTEVHVVSGVVLETAVRLAVSRLDEIGITSLRELLSRPFGEGESDANRVADIERQLLQLSGNPAVELFGELLLRCVQIEDPFGEDLLAITDVARAVAASDVVGAAGALRERQRIQATRLRSGGASWKVALDPGWQSERLAERLAYRIFRDIADAGWPLGVVLGSERELLERYEVGRGVLREAARLLEFHSVAYMRRGPSGGLVVDEPTPLSVAMTASVYLDFRRIEPRHLIEVGRDLELLNVALAVENLDDAGEQRLREYLKSGFADRESFSFMIGELGGNRAAAVFIVVLIALSNEFSDPERTREADRVRDQLLHASDLYPPVVEAVIDRDVVLARFRLAQVLAEYADVAAASPPRSRRAREPLAGALAEHV